MKYEYLKGSDKDFEGATDECTKIIVAFGTKYLVIGDETSCGLPVAPSDFINYMTAERQPITEPSWIGVGLPPVGCECEFKAEDGSWGAGTVLFVGKMRVFWLCHEDGMEYNAEIEPREFRPIRSEADKKRDAVIEFITGAIDSHGFDPLNSAKFIYDAIAAGKIPGVKLGD